MGKHHDAGKRPEDRRAPLPDRLRAGLDRRVGGPTDPQPDELRTGGCAVALEEHASRADRTRPVLARLLCEIRPGDTLVLVRLDRLARSVSHLLAVLEQLEAIGAHFPILSDTIDTSTPQGMFPWQVLGAVGRLERALIPDRTKAGLRRAHKRGGIGGNPGRRSRDPQATRKVHAGRDANMGRISKRGVRQDKLS